jgi:hypothetical protein
MVFIWFLFYVALWCGVRMGADMDDRRVNLVKISFLAIEILN